MEPSRASNAFPGFRSSGKHSPPSVSARPSRSTRRSSSDSVVGPGHDIVLESEGEDEITRCVCDLGDSFGIMVQCEQCMAWQHCECMNVNPKRLPKHYFCEQCKPVKHPYFTLNAQPRVSTRPQEVPVAPPAPAARNSGKRRSTMNSRETADGYAQPSPVGPVSEPPTPTVVALTVDTETKRGKSRSGSQDATSASAGGSRKASTDISQTQQLASAGPAVGSAPPTPTSEVRSKRKRRANGSGTQEVPAPLERATKRRSQNHTGKEDQVVQLPSAPIPELSSGRPSLRRNASVQSDSQPSNKGTRSQRSTQASAMSRKQQQQAPPPIVTTNAMVEKVSYKITSSPKTRIPHAKSSMGEMNKRVKHLSDYITRLQVSMAGGSAVVFPTPSSAAVKVEVSVSKASRRFFPASTPSTGSSDVTTLSAALAGPAAIVPINTSTAASNIVASPDALLAPSTGASSVAGDQPESSLLILDRLNLRLIKFQKRFGDIGKR
ncbi:hypothetical protein HKX48_007130 [Thoreauomyces humboldtii]|nr:hypothetical protein HKX48_007130 [Thoreauomyces humboldtii]